MGLGVKILLTGLLFWVISTVLVKILYDDSYLSKGILNVLQVIWYASAAIMIVGTLIAIWV